MIDAEKFFAGYRAIFGGLSQSQVDGLNFLISAFNADPRWSDLRNVAYALATIRHETGNTYQPIHEIGSDKYLSKYWTNENLRENLGNIEPADAAQYKGRGYVQITGRFNYTHFGIADSPEKALEPQTAFEIMTRGMFEGAFTGKRLASYITPSGADYVHARKIINGLDRADTIAEYARQFVKILTAAQTPTEATGSVEGSET